MKRIIWWVLMLTAFSFASVREHTVIMHIEGGLRQSDGYKIEGLNTPPTYTDINIWKTNGTEDSLEAVSIFETDKGTGDNAFKSGNNYKYDGINEYKYVTFKVAGNTDNIKEIRAEFNLKEELRRQDNNEIYTNIYIEEDFYLPINYIKLEEKEYKFGNRFSYEESAEIISRHKELYKKQDYMVRLVKGNTANYKYDVHNKNNGIRLANEGDNIKEFLSSTKNYIDFKFNGDFYNEVQSVITSYGTGMNFVPGNIEVFGLPNNEYTIEFYSFRYKNEFSDRDNLIITLEDRISFTGSGIEEKEGLSLLNFSSEKYPEISAVLLSISENNIDNISIREGVKGETLSEIAVENMKKISLKDQSIFINGEKIDLDGDSKHGDKYYKKWELTHSSNEKRGIRQVEYFYKLGDVEYKTIAEYRVDFAIPVNTAYPHQTVIARFNPNKDWGTNEKFQIKDIVMPKESLAYKQIKMTNSESMDKFMKGSFTDAFTLTQRIEDFLWDGDGRKVSNSLIFRKAISASKGTLIKGIKDIFNFYTTRGISAFSYIENINSVESATDKATFTWSSTPRNTYGVNITDDKIMFRISRLGESESPTDKKNYSVGSHNLSENLPKHYFKLYEKTNQVQENIGAFVSGTASYVDLIFDVGMDKEVEGGNALFSFSRNNQFRISSLPRGRYLIQAYTIQDSDSNSKLDSSYDYRVITYSGYKDFFMGLPAIVSGEFANSNNIFLIENINLTSEYDETKEEQVKKIRLNFLTKAEQSLSLTENNLVPALYETDETSTEFRTVKEIRDGNIKVVENLKLSRSEQVDFQFPLDIIFLIDSSGSMLPHVENLRDGIEAFTSSLVSRGFDVNFNMIAFGAPHTTEYNVLKGYEYVRVPYTEDNRRQNSIRNGYITGTWHNRVTTYDGTYIAKYKENWFDGSTISYNETQKKKELSELIDALTQLNPYNGYPGGPENAFHAMHFGIKHFKSKGRYLDFNNRIVSNNQKRDGYIPSQKMLVLLTDENGSINRLNQMTGANYQNGGEVIDGISKELRENNIVLTSIHKTSVIVNETSLKDYKDKLGIDLIQNWTWVNSNNNRIISNNDGEAFYRHTNNHSRDNRLYKIYRNTNSVLRYNEITEGGIYYYRYNPGENNETWYSISISKSENLLDNVLHLKDKLGRKGSIPNDTGGRFISEFALQGLGDLFNMYSIDENIGNSLSYSANNIGIVQRWIMEYDSQFVDSDGLQRQVIFSLDGITKQGTSDKLKIDPVIRKRDNGTDRHYNVPEQKIDGFFINPHGDKLTMKDGQIELRARVWSQYKNEDGHNVNYPIIRGTYTISNGENTMLIDSKEIHHGNRVEIEEIDNNGKKEYELFVSLNQREFLDKFPVDKKLSIELSALTRDLGIRLYADKLEIMEQDPPKVVGIKLINQTARDLLKSLNDVGLGMTTENLEKNTSVYIGDFSDSSKIPKLNVKGNDKILVELEIEEENFEDWLKTNNGDNKNNVLTINGVDVKNLKIGEKINGVITITGEMIISNILSDISNKNMKIQLTDDLGNKMSNSLDIEVLEFPKVIDTIKLKANENPVSTDYKNYYKHINGEENQAVTLSVDILEEKKEDILAYIAVFNFDKEKSDKKLDVNYPSLEDKEDIKYLFSLDGNFNFKDGEHHYLIYPINKAGEIKDTKETENIKIIEELHDKIKENKDKFYIDTVAPELSGEVIGTKNRNWADLPSDVIKIVKERDEFKNETYKNGDTLAVKVTLTEFNPYKVEVFKKQGQENIMIKSETGDFNEIELEIGNSHEESDKYIVRAIDKAGNITEIELELKYNNDVPKGVEVKTLKHGTDNLFADGYKFINKEKGRIQGTGQGVDSVYILAKSSEGSKAWHSGNLGKLIDINANLVSGDGKRTFTFYSFAPNGNFVETIENVVVDNSINYSSASIRPRSSVVSFKTSGNYTTKLNFDDVTEYVGLASYVITNATLEKVTGNISDDLTTKNQPSLNPVGGVTGEPTISFTHNVPQDKILKIKFVDKLGNEKVIDYHIVIKSQLEIIGTKAGENQEIRSTIDIGGNNINIKGRSR